MPPADVIPGPGVAPPPFEVDLVVEDDRWHETHPGLAEVCRVAVGAALAGAPGEVVGPRPVEVCVVATDDDTVRGFNRDMRRVDAPTNVLAFASREIPDLPAVAPGEAEGLGDVVLALETVRREAAEKGLPLDHHLCHLLVHGVLHLLGYDHREDDEAEAMERLEARVLSGLGIADPYGGTVGADPATRHPPTDREDAPSGDGPVPPVAPRRDIR